MYEQPNIPKVGGDHGDPQPKDISKEFLTLEGDDFRRFLRGHRKEPWLDITVDWKDVWQVRRLKAFVDSYDEGQRRTATVRATEEQYREDVNAFQSGVKWVKI